MKKLFKVHRINKIYQIFKKRKSSLVFYFIFCDIKGFSRKFYLNVKKQKLYSLK